MSFFESILSHPLILQWGWVLVHFLWQGALLTLLAAIALLCTSRVSPSRRYVLLISCLYASLVCPVITWTILYSGDSSRHPVESVDVNSRVTAASIVGNSTASNLDPDHEHIVGTVTTSEIIPQYVATRQHTFALRISTALPYCVAAWLLGVALLSTRLIGAWWLTIRTVKYSETLRGEYVDQMQRYISQLKLRGVIRWIESPHVDVPQVIGWIRPVIIVPITLFTTLGPREIESLLLHELVHIRRYDFLANLLQCLIETLFFFHPGILWLSRRVRLERELACDQTAVALTGDRLTFSRALLSLADRASLPRPALAANDSDLTTRIYAVLGLKRSSFAPGFSTLVCCIAMIVAVATLMVGFLATDKAYTQDNSLAKVERFLSSGETIPEIKGRVVDASGQSVAGAIVYLRHPKRSDEFHDVARTTTNSKGEFAFTDVLIDRESQRLSILDVVAIKEGLSIGWKHVPLSRSESNIVLALKPSATIEGTVVNAAGQPVANAQLKVQHLMSIRHITQADLEEGRWPSLRDGDFVNLEHFQESPNAITDQNGRFRLDGIPGDRGVILQAIHPLYLLQTVYAASIDQLDPTSASKSKRIVQTGQLSFALKPGYQLRIVVTDEETSKPINNIRYSLSNAVSFPPTQTSANGVIEINHLPTPSFPVIIYPPHDTPYLACRNQVSWPAEQRVHEIAIRLRKGAIVSGSVIDDQSKIGIPNVPVATHGLQPFLANTATHFPPWPATTDKEGHFVLACPPGQFSFAVSDRILGYVESRDPLSNQAEVSVSETAADTSPVISLTPAPRLRLVVKYPYSSPAANVAVTARAHASLNSYRPIEGKTNQDGVYVLNELFMQDSPFQSFMIEEVILRDSDNRFGAQLLVKRPHIKAPIEQELQVQLVELGTATGRVVDSQTGQGVQGVQINLYKEDFDLSSASAVGEYTTSGADGKFELPGVLPGIQHNLSMSHTRYKTPNGAQLQFEIRTSGPYDFGDIQLESLSALPNTDLAQVTAVDVSGLPPEQAFEKLKVNSEASQKTFRAEFDDLNKKYSGDLIVQRRDSTPDYCEAMLKLAQAAPESDIALKSCIWIVNASIMGGSRTRSAESQAAARKILQTNFIDRPEMSQCIGVAISKYCDLQDYQIEANPQSLADAAEQLMQANQNRDVHARTCFYVAKRFMDTLSHSRFGRQPAASMKELCRKYLTRVENEFPEYEHFYFGTYGAGAKRMLFELDNMLLGCTPPDLSGVDVTGKQIKLSDYRGKLVLIDFWERSFDPATHDHHSLKHILPKASDRVAVLGVVSSAQDTVQAIVDKFKIDYPMFADGDRGPMFTQWNIQTWPTVVLLDANGVILYRGSRGQDLENVLLNELAKTK